MYRYPLYGAIGVAIVLAIFFGAQQFMALTDEQFTNNESVLIPTETVNVENQLDKIQVTDGVKHIVPLDKIRGGGPPKDGIPSIDNPKFANMQGSQFVSDSDVVIGLEIDGEAKAYPLFILVWHEIVNDSRRCASCCNLLPTMLYKPSV